MEQFVRVRVRVRVRVLVLVRVRDVMIDQDERLLDQQERGGERSKTEDTEEREKREKREKLGSEDRRGLEAGVAEDARQKQDLGQGQTWREGKGTGQRQAQ